MRLPWPHATKIHRPMSPCAHHPNVTLSGNEGSGVAERSTRSYVHRPLPRSLAPLGTTWMVGLQRPPARSATIASRAARYAARPNQAVDLGAMGIENQRRFHSHSGPRAGIQGLGRGFPASAGTFVIPAKLAPDSDWGAGIHRGARGVPPARTEQLRGRPRA